ncbi:hypothetical protein M011DRAFT_467110 [Sporormia fimetaria CBS 119925]|uniref:Uncharacterized protein n=1 Tax=Sporormia fimetaria CBS 119925 TaxID=1340428 RepID=A0A6A6VEA8_9PLEO|nr:hypothetical protein M011DRAFT_467110 [Sporormia fimetaria CBS 119925]
MTLDSKVPLERGADDYQLGWRQSRSMVLSMCFFCLCCPPMAIYLDRGSSSSILFNFFLCFLGYLPGIIHAISYVLLSPRRPVPRVRPHRRWLSPDSLIGDASEPPGLSKGVTITEELRSQSYSCEHDNHPLEELWGKGVPLFQAVPIIPEDGVLDVDLIPQHT